MKNFNVFVIAFLLFSLVFSIIGYCYVYTYKSSPDFGIAADYCKSLGFGWFNCTDFTNPTNKCFCYWKDGDGVVHEKQIIPLSNGSWLVSEEWYEEIRRG